MSRARRPLNEFAKGVPVVFELLVCIRECGLGVIKPRTDHLILLVRDLGDFDQLYLVKYVSYLKTHSKTVNKIEI
ncbi:hypothetical protein [Halalkalicoccus ordinarius]|uniref:hypothetical protein n=1 Tax=Halalkalicoccus ordinarius TaxID=3116651 RepID=UPI00300EB10C